MVARPNRLSDSEIAQRATGVLRTLARGRRPRIGTRFRFPGIENHGAESGEILDVAGDDGQVMDNRRRRDHSVGGVERHTSQLGFPVEDSPSVGDRLSDG